jgi:AraC-like DNA-binding protein
MNNILIIENRLDVSKELNIKLNKDFNLIFTDCTIKAIDYIMYSDLDLIILGMEFKLPLDTENFVYNITKSKEKKDIPILLVGNENEYNKIKVGLSYGAKDFAYFPFLENNLNLRVQSIIKNLSICSNSNFTNNIVFKSENFQDKFESIGNKYIFQKRLSLQELSNEMGMSISTLNRKCKFFYNDTPSNLISNKKLEASIQIFSLNNESVKCVSHQLGFRSVQHFCLSFKKKYNNSPKKHLQSLLVNDMRYV